jgi:hypothetical protein
MGVELRTLLCQDICDREWEIGNACMLELNRLHRAGAERRGWIRGVEPRRSPGRLPRLGFFD